MRHHLLGACSYERTSHPLVRSPKWIDCEQHLFIYEGVAVHPSLLTILLSADSRCGPGPYMLFFLDCIASPSYGLASNTRIARVASTDQTRLDGGCVSNSSCFALCCLGELSANCTRGGMVTLLIMYVRASKTVPALGPAYRFPQVPCHGSAEVVPGASLSTHQYTQSPIVGWALTV